MSVRLFIFVFFFFSRRRRHTSFSRDWSSDVCSSDLLDEAGDLAFKAFEYAHPDGPSAGAMLVITRVTAAPNGACRAATGPPPAPLQPALHPARRRSEERRVGKESRQRSSAPAWKQRS